MHRQAYILLLMTTLFWGGNAVAGKLALGHVSPMLLNMGRWAIAFAILAAAGREEEGEYERRAVRHGSSIKVCGERVRRSDGV